jgi:hypothetical protein
MGAAYMQQQMPNNITGVKVSLTAVDPNGNFQNIGTTISKSDSTFAISWTPPVPGMYHVTATLEDSNAYYTSSGATYFLVNSAPSAILTPTPTPIATQPPIMPVSPSLTQTSSPTPSSVVQPPTSQIPTTTYVAIASTILIAIAVAAALILRRKK